MTDPSSIAGMIEVQLKGRYGRQPRDENEKILDGILKFAMQVNTEDLNRPRLLQEAAKMIHRLFQFEEITIATRDDDGLFRFGAFIGFTQEAERSMRARTYTEEEVLQLDKKQGIRISKLSEMAISEAEPIRKGEEAEYNRPIMINVPRKSLEEFTPGDYISVYLMGLDDETIGFLELSAPRDRKMPQGSTLKWIELFSLVIAAAIKCEKKEEVKGGAASR